jgi:hypothetical protein
MMHGTMNVKITEISFEANTDPDVAFFVVRTTGRVSVMVAPQTCIWGMSGLNFNQVIGYPETCRGFIQFSRKTLGQHLESVTTASFRTASNSSFNSHSSAGHRLVSAHCRHIYNTTIPEVKKLRHKTPFCAKIMNGCKDASIAHTSQWCA